MEKHYDADYLNQTALAVGGIKQQSYDFFKAIKNGVIVDLGCGNGVDVKTMQKCLSSSNSFYGIDHDERMLQDLNKQNTEENLSFMCADAMRLPFENNAVNGLRSERMFQHLVSPTDVMHEIYRVLVTNAPFIVIETDWQGINLYSDNIEIEAKLSRYLVDKKVNFGLASRKLPKLITDHNFTLHKSIVSQVLIRSLSTANLVIKLEEILAEMVQYNYLSEEHKKLFVNELNEKDVNGVFNCSIDMITFHATKN